MPKYLAYRTKTLRDGVEESGRIVANLDEALALVNIWNDGLALCRQLSQGCQLDQTFQVFKLGKEVPLAKEIIEEPQPAKKVVSYRAKG